MNHSAFKYLLITRLNVFYKTKMAGRGIDPERWLIERIEIFKKTCLPSILNQSNKNFIWFIYIDRRTPNEIMDYFSELLRPYPFIKLIVHDYESFNLTRYLQSDIISFLGDDFEYLISTRVDTDDLLFKDYVALVQGQFSYQEYQAINFYNGMAYDVPTGISSMLVHSSNAFISLIEKRTVEGFKTVFYKPHTDYQNDQNKFEFKTKEPMWCFTTHGLNDSTGFYGKVKIFNQPNLIDAFGFAHQQVPSFGNIVRFWSRSFLRTVIRVKKKLLG